MTKLIKATIEYPTDLRLDYKPSRLAKLVGPKLARRLRSALLGGRTADGQTLPKPSDGGRPLYRTGQLLESIEYDSGSMSVRPTGRRSDVAGGSNEDLLRILIAKLKIDPLGTESPKEDRHIAKEIEGALDKELRSGRVKLVGRTRKVK